MNAEVAQMPAVQTHAPVVAFTPRDEFELALRQAKVYAASTIVPEAYRDNLPNCLIALNMAKRIGMDPLQTMQNLYIVHGRPGWSGQSMIGMFNQCGRFTAIRFEWRGEEGSKNRGCRAYATEKSTGEKVIGTWIDWKMVEAEGWNKKSGSKWLTIPELMFQYRAASWLIRTHAPEIALGLPMAEELQDVIDITPESQDTSPASAVETAKQAVAAALGKEPAPQEATPQKPNAPTYVEVRHAMESATEKDTIDLAESLVDHLPEQFRPELHELAKQRREAVAGK